MQEHWSSEWNQIQRNSQTGHEDNWPHGVLLRNQNRHWDWNELQTWLTDNIGQQHDQWAVGRFELLFKQQDQLTLFQLTWL